MSSEKKGLKIKNQIRKINKKFTHLIKNKKVISVILIIFGCAIIPTGILTSLNTQTFRAPHLVNDKFSEILLSVKDSIVDNFTGLLESMSEDPLNGLYVEKLPSPEEIFYEEWANDRFPEVYIPLIGGYIQSIGSEIVGDINLDDKPPKADLNITSCNNPSGLTLDQCESLWDSNESLSLVSSNPTYWIQGAEGEEGNNDILRYNFNLTLFQLSLILNWVNISKETWMREMIYESQIVINPFLFAGGLVIGGISITIGGFVLKSELFRMRKIKSKKNQES